MKSVLLILLISFSMTASTIAIADDDSKSLLHMREEEKLAHDLYSAYADLYDLPIFENISRSESNHMQAVLMLLEKFGLKDPASAEAGVFNDSSLQTTYDNLLGSGKLSLTDALKSGAYVEELDILDLEKYLEVGTNESIKMVYANLLRASRNHLRAFTRVLLNNGVTYEPRLLSSEYYDKVVNEEMGQCGKGQKGRRGYGKNCKN